MQASSYEEIMGRLLARVPEDMDKREGSLIYDALAPVALEIQILLIEMENNRKEAYADTASREYLIRRAKERGLKPYPATNAEIKAEVLPIDAEVPEGARFTGEGAIYRVTEKIAAGQYRLRCEEAGETGNRLNIDLIPIEYLENLQKIKIVQLLIPAEEEEATEDFRKRYFNSFASQSFGGNIADYKEKVKAISGVVGVKVTPVWQGAGTVKLTILSSDYAAPSTELIQQVQEKIDPTENTGKGYGIAPIGHKVTVDGVSALSIDIQTTITYQSGWNYEASKSYIEKAIDGYFKELAKEWEVQKELVVRISQIETRLLNAPGILDIQKTKLNGQDTNLILEEMQIPKRGVFHG